jgi:hypothetical protein
VYKSLLTAPKLPRPDAVAVALHDKTNKLSESYTAIDRASGGAISAALKRPDFSPGGGSVIAMHAPTGPRLYVLGLGTKEQFQVNHLRAAASRLVPMLHAGARSARGSGSARLSSMRSRAGPTRRRPGSEPRARTG